MTARLVLDSEALSALGGQRSARQAEVRAALRAAQRLHREVVVPTVVLAELYRGPHHNHMVDACLARETGIATRDTDRPFARVVGGVLAAAGAGSSLLGDAHVIAAAVETGGGVVLTGDPADMGRLAAPTPPSSSNNCLDGAQAELLRVIQRMATEDEAKGEPSFTTNSTMKVKTLAELTTPDPRALRFTPLGLSPVPRKGWRLSRGSEPTQ